MPSKEDIVPEHQSRKQLTSKPSVCYLVTSPDTPLQAIRTLLTAKGLETIGPSDLLARGPSILGTLTEAISRSDLVIAILSVGQFNAHAYLEMGVAVAYGARILIVAPLEVQLPFEVSEIPSVRTSIENVEAISFAIDQVLQIAPPGKYKLWRSTSKSRPLGDSAEVFLHRFTEINMQKPWRDAEKEIINLLIESLHASGISIIAQSSADMRADLAVWSDEFDPWVGNPLLIEFKKSLNTQSEGSAVLNQVTRFIQHSKTRSALVLYVEATKEGLNELAGSPFIFMLEIRQMLIELRKKSFPEIVRGLRDRKVHGLGV